MMFMVVHKSHRRKNSAGIVSILVTLIMMIVITLIIVGFTQLSTQNRRQALDRQLSNQAFYAAESGINDTLRIIKSINGTIPIKPDCANNPPYDSLNTSGTLDATVKYTCIKVDPLVKEIRLQNLSPGESRLIKVNTKNADGTTSNNVAQFVFNWSPKIGTNVDYSSENVNGTCTDAGDNWDQTSYQCPYAVVRVDVLKLSGLSSMSAANLAKNTVTLFIYPNGGLALMTAGSIKSAADGSITINGVAGKKVGMYGSGCNYVWAYCGGAINVEGGASGTSYLMRVTPLQTTATGFSVLAYSNAAFPSDESSRLYFADQQVLIDSTGQSNGVLRRVQVRANVNGLSAQGVPLGAIESRNDVCKAFGADDASGTGYVAGPCTD